MQCIRDGGIFANVQISNSIMFRLEIGTSQRVVTRLCTLMSFSASNQHNMFFFALIITSFDQARKGGSGGGAAQPYSLTLLERDFDCCILFAQRALLENNCVLVYHVCIWQVDVVPQFKFRHVGALFVSDLVQHRIELVCARCGRHFRDDEIVEDLLDLHEGEFCCQRVRISFSNQCGC